MALMHLKQPGRSKEIRGANQSAPISPERLDRLDAVDTIGSYNKTGNANVEKQLWRSATSQPASGF